MKWRCSAQAGGLKRSKFCLFLVVLPVRCIFNVSPRFYFRRQAFCFLPLAAILGSIPHDFLFSCGRLYGLILPEGLYGLILPEGLYRNSCGREKLNLLKGEYTVCRKLVALLTCLFSSLHKMIVLTWSQDGVLNS
jgi:hypothetical protein